MSMTGKEKTEAAKEKRVGESVERGIELNYTIVPQSCDE